MQNRKNTPNKGNNLAKKSQDTPKSFEKNNFQKRDFTKYKKTVKPKPTVSEEEGIRLNKFIANSGTCSRRDADLYIKSGNVKVNGVVVTEMGYKVKPNEVVVFDGITIVPEKKIYLLLNKPKGFSTAEEANGSSVQDLIRAASNYPLRPIGRMDKTSLGLLLFTNDHEMIEKFTNSAQRSSKLYQVSLDKNLKYEDLEKIQKGVTVNEHKVYVEEINYVENQPKSEVGVKVKTSNVKIVRLLFESLGYDVIKLDRVMFARLTKWGIARGQWRYLTSQEVINLKNS